MHSSKYNYSLNCFVIQFVALLFLVSCNEIDPKTNNFTSIIHVDMDNTETPEKIILDEVIPLQTTEDCIIGKVAKIIHFGNRIIVLDHLYARNMFIFDLSGNLLFRTTHGGGPGEVSNPRAIAIDRRDSIIYLYEELVRKVRRYDLNGVYIDSRNVSGLFLYDFAPLGDEKFLVYHTMRYGESTVPPIRTTYSICNDDFSDFEPLDEFLTSKESLLVLLSPINMSSDQKLFVVPWSNNVYEFMEDGIKEKYSLDFGKHSLKPDLKETNDISTILPLVRSSFNSKVGGLLSVFSNSNYVIVVADYGRHALPIIHSKKDKKTYSLRNYIDQGLLPECVPWGINDSNYIFALVQPADFIVFNKKSQRYGHLNITLDSNPIIIKIKMK
ncbi:MAG: 6-bladed beta-propeller [Bacteroidota bacterium]|nr:6-bladed beta-propeller [Bacteroidota bacterium]